MAAFPIVRGLLRDGPAAHGPPRDPPLLGLLGVTAGSRCWLAPASVWLVEYIRRQLVDNEAFISITRPTSTT
jgi:hypothetical protein